MKNFRFSTKLLMGAAVACALSLSMVSCDDDDDDDPAPTNNNGGGNTGAPEVLVGLDIDANTTWTSDNIYVLTSRIKVRPGATLTIEPGTIIKGSEGQGVNAKVLMVMRDATIIADGTASDPIIFTSTNDQIQPGQIESPNLPNDLVGQWGGLALLGNAIISSGTSAGGFDVDQIEGVPTSDTDGLYGGNDNADNSGILRYVSVRHGGTEIGGGDELNGISFGGVGSGTTVEYIEIVANADDGLEFYGGAVNATNVVVWNNGDDALDTDQDYVGTIDNVFIVGPAGSVMELDGPEGTIVSGNLHTIQNGTAVAVRPDNTTAGDLLNFDANTNIAVNNMYYAQVDAAQRLNANSVDATNASFSNITLNVTAGTAGSYVNAGEPDLTAAVSVGSTGQADAADFAGWSWAGVAGNLGSL